MIKFLKRIVKSIYILTLCVEKGIFPNSMKTSRTIPVFKKEGSSRDRSNYRPISLINCFLKMFEKSIYVRIKHFLDSNNFFYSHQYGFRDGRIIQQEIIKTSNFISEAINNEELVVGLF